MADEGCDLIETQLIMENYPASFDQMLDAWNEADPSKIRSLLDAALTPDVYFVDPTTEITGIDAVEKLIHDVQKRFPGAVFSRVSQVDSHHHIHRYYWEIHIDGALLVQGFDVLEFRDEKVARLLKFFGELPLTRDQ
jgi:hypothetical protein